MCALPPPIPSYLAWSASSSVSSSSSSSSSKASEGSRKRKTTGADPTALPPGFWSKADDDKLRAAVEAEGPKNWKKIAEEYFENVFTDTQCLNRWYKVLTPGLVKGPWTKEEDDIIILCMQTGVTKWAKIAEQIPGRLGKQCRERWLNHLDPTIKKGEWTAEEDAALMAAQAAHGNSWTKVAEALPGRSENAVKNRWNSAFHVKARKQAAQPKWDEALEATVVTAYCREVAAADTTTTLEVTDMLACLLAKLEAANPTVYGSLDPVYVPELRARLCQALEAEARQLGTDTPLARALFVMPTAAGASGKKYKKKKGSIGGGRKSKAQQQAVEAVAPPAAAAAAVTEPSETLLPTPSSPPPPVAAAAATGGVSPKKQEESEEACTKRGRFEKEDVMAEQAAQDVSIQHNHPCPTPHHNHHHHRHNEEEEDSISSISAMSSMASLDTEDEHDAERRRSSSSLDPATLSPPPPAAALPKKAKTSLSFGGSCGGLSSLALAVSSLSSPSTSMDTSVFSKQEKPIPAAAAAVMALPVVSHSPSKRLREIISLLFSAMRDEVDFTRRGLLQDALDAATQELPPMVNFVEGVLGGSNCAGFSLAVEADRHFILDQLMTATHRGVFGPGNHPW